MESSNVLAPGMMRGVARDGRWNVQVGNNRAHIKDVNVNDRSICYCTIECSACACVVAVCY